MRGVLAALLVIAATGCAATQQEASFVRGRAAYDFGCDTDSTHVTDAEVGVYRVEGCGYAATYQCDETQIFEPSCRQLFANKLEGSTPDKDAEGSPSLAKTR